MPSSPAHPPSARQRVREAIQSRILGGQLIPGQRLTQADLAREFSVAQTVIRESLLVLSFCGLVKIVENVGVFVSELEPAMLLEAYQIREVFEGLAARLCCENASRRDLAELSDQANQILALGLAGRVEEMGRLDREFHLRTIHISRHQLLHRLTEGYRLVGMIVRAQRDITEIHSEHLGIVEAIDLNGPDEAERRARVHVRASRQAVQQMVDEGRFRPYWVVEPEQEDKLSARATETN